MIHETILEVVPISPFPSCVICIISETMAFGISVDLIAFPCKKKKNESKDCWNTIIQYVLQECGYAFLIPSDYFLLKGLKIYSLMQ